MQYLHPVLGYEIDNSIDKLEVQKQVSNICGQIQSRSSRLLYSLQLCSVSNSARSKLFSPHFESSYSSVKISIIVAGFAPVSKGFHNLLANLNYVLLQKQIFLNPWCFMLLIPCYFILNACSGATKN